MGIARLISQAQLSPQSKTVVYERAILPSDFDSFVFRHRGNVFWLKLSVHKENSTAHEIPRLFHYVFQNLMAISDIHETWHDRYAIRVHPTTLRFNFLRKNYLTGMRTSEVGATTESRTLGA